MGKKQKAKKKADEAIAPQPSRDYSIPGVETHLCSQEKGMPVDQFLAIAFNLAAANPGAKVSFHLTLKDPTDGD